MWKRISCGAGTKGERLYEWAVVSWPAPAEDGSAKSDFTKSLLVRRSLKDPDEKAYYYTHAPSGTPLKTLVEIAGMRWAIEECFEQAKQLTGLDEYEVRSWTGWYRHVTLSMFAHAMLAVIRATAVRCSQTRIGEKGGEPLIPLTVPEVRRLLVRLVFRRLLAQEQTLACSLLAATPSSSRPSLPLQDTR